MSLLLSQLGGGGSDSVTVDAGALTLTGQSIATVDVLPIDAANLTLTGQSIVSVDVCPITAADLSLSGSSILELDTIGITAGALAFSGSNITEVGTVGIVSTNLPLAGQDITVTDVGADAVETPPQQIYGRWPKDFLYDRPYLAEYAEALRKAVAVKKLEKAEEIAEKIVEVALGQPTAPLQFQGVIDIASRLRDLDRLEQRVRLSLARSLVIRAKAADLALRDEEDVEMLLLG